MNGRNGVMYTYTHIVKCALLNIILKLSTEYRMYNNIVNSIVLMWSPLY